MKEVTIDCLTMSHEEFREGSLAGALMSVLDELVPGETVKIVEVKNREVRVKRGRGQVLPVIGALRNSIRQVEQVNFHGYSTWKIGTSLVVTRVI